MKSVFLSLVLFFSTILVVGQSWRSSLYPTTWTPPIGSNFYTDSFLQDYSYAGYGRGEKSIPQLSGKVFDVTKAPYNADNTGVIDATSAIQKAITDAQTNNGGVVYLPAGTYLVAPGTNAYCLQITKSNISIKGDGVGKTFIRNGSYSMRSKCVINVTGSSSWNNATTKALFTSDMMTPVKIIPIDNPSLFAVGDLVVVRNYINDSWINEHNEPNWLGNGASLGGIIYCRYITAVDVVNKTITIDVPLRYALKTRDGACVYKISGMISEVALTDFSIGNIQHPSLTGWGEDDYNISGTAGYDCHDCYLVRFSRVVNSWMKNVSTYKPAGNTTGAQMLSNGVLVTYSKNITVDSCTMSYGQYGGGGGNGYGFRVSANEVLISNSTHNYSRHGFVFASMYCSGNVIHNCKDINTGIQCGSTGGSATSGWGSDFHMHFIQSNLIDKCYSENSSFVAFYRDYGTVPKHGLTATQSTFWNTSSGGNNGFCIWTQQSRYGYAIGTSGSSSAVYTKENGVGSAAKTGPVDIVEGVGAGATLMPQSLYQDQLAKRLASLYIKNNNLQMPGIIEAEDFNDGGDGVGYHDTDAINQGGAARVETGVDVQACSEGGFNVSYTLPDEWLKYSVTVANAGVYTVLLRYATTATDKKLHISVNGVNQTNSITLANTNGWQTYQSVTTTLNLIKGVNEIEIYFETGGVNLNYLMADTSTALDNVMAEVHFAIFPNPFNDLLFVECKNGELASMQLVDTQGQLLIAENVNASSKSINVAKLGAGVYFVKLNTTNNRSEIHKVIKL